jgi:uncharacterized protein YxjI
MVDLRGYDELIVQQQVEPLEVFTGFETQNRYSVLTPQGDALLYAYEESGFMARQFLRTHRPLTINVMDDQSNPVLSASRSFYWFFSHLHIKDAAERHIGSLRRRFAIFTRKFTLEGPDGLPIAEMRGPLFRPNTFMIYQQDMEVARVTKRWSGFMREGFSKADTFQVQFSGPSRDQDFSLLVLATAFAIDLDFFEDRGRGRSHFAMSHH